MGVISELISRCEEALKNFNPVTHTLDAYTSDLFGPAEAEDNAGERIFIKQVLYGCVRYKHALKIAITSFYFNNSSKASRSDYTKYMIFGYLSIFRLEDLGFDDFKKIVCSQQSEKMHVFLTYMFSKENLEAFIKDEWIKLYDLKFVEDKMINKMLAFLPQVEELCEDLSRLAFGMIQKREEKDKSAGIPNILSKPPTIVKPFQLSESRPFRVPEPIKISQAIKANPVPGFLKNNSLAAVEERRMKAKEEMFLKSQEKYEKLSHMKFNLHETKDTVSALIEKKNNNLERILNKKFVAKEAPDYSNNEAQVQMNLAAVLREDAVYKKKQEQEANLLKAYESELRDSTTFYEWQTKMREEDEKSRLRMVDQRRQESVQSAEEARLALERQLEFNRATAQRLKLESEQIKQKKQKERWEKIEQNKVIVEAVHERKPIPAQEKAKIFKKNQINRKKMETEQKQREAEKKENDRLELEKRKDLIRQIRALERVPAVVVKQFDPTTRVGHGLLEELSLVELRERLAMNQKRDEEIEDERRKKILKEKSRKENELQVRIKSIQRARRAAAEENRKNRIAKKEKELQKKKQEEETKNESKAKLAVKLAEIRQERIKEIKQLQEEEEKLQKMRMFLGEAKNMVEEKVHEEFLKGAERQARERQQSKQVDAQRLEEIRSRENKIREDNRRAEQLLKKSRDLAAKQKFSAAKKVNKEENYKNIKEKKNLVKIERNRYTTACEKNSKINEYKTDMMRNVPLRLIMNMGRDELFKFYSGKPNDIRLAIEHLFQGKKTFNSAKPATKTNFGTAISAVNAIYDKIHE